MTTDTAKLERLLTEATKGPWIEGQDGNCRVYGPDGEGVHTGLIAVVYKGRPNTSLIVEAVNALPDMLAELKALRGELEWIEAFADIRSKDDSKTFARVNRGALRTIASRARTALDQGGGSPCLHEATNAYVGTQPGVANWIATCRLYGKAIPESEQAEAVKRAEERG